MPWSQTIRSSSNCNNPVCAWERCYSGNWKELQTIIRYPSCFFYLFLNSEALHKVVYNERLNLNHSVVYNLVKTKRFPHVNNCAAAQPAMQTKTNSTEGCTNTNTNHTNRPVSSHEKPHHFLTAQAAGVTEMFLTLPFTTSAHWERLQ